METSHFLSSLSCKLAPNFQTTHLITTVPYCHVHKHAYTVVFVCSLVGEVFDVLGEKQHVSFDDLAKLHQLGLVRRLFVISGVIIVMLRPRDFYFHLADAMKLE